MDQSSAYLLTIGIELPIVLALSMASRLAPGHMKDVAVTTVCASTITHPLLWSADAWLAPLVGARQRLYLLESLVILAEAAIFVRVLGLPLRKALLLSLAANLLSVAIGFEFQ